MSPSRRLGLALAFATVLLWGFLAIALKVAVASVPTVTIVWFRFTFAFAVLLVILLSRSPARLKILRRPPGYALGASFCLTANYVTYLAGLDHTSPTVAQVLIQLGPLILAGIGVVIFREHVTRRQMLGVLVATLGFGLFFHDKWTGVVGPADTFLTGNLMIVVAAVTWAGYATYSKLLSRDGYAPQDINLVTYAGPTLVLLPFVEWSELSGLAAEEWMLMLFLGCNTLLAYGALAEALKRLPAHQVSLVIATTPSITLGAMAFLDAWDVPWIARDPVGIWGYLGAALVVLGVARALHKRKQTATGERIANS